jgi:hypothetical protein
MSIVLSPWRIFLLAMPSLARRASAAIFVLELLAIRNNSRNCRLLRRPTVRRTYASYGGRISCVMP